MGDPFNKVNKCDVMSPKIWNWQIKSIIKYIKFVCIVINSLYVDIVCYTLNEMYL